jgi:Protein of unknown function (DUF2628)
MTCVRMDAAMQVGPPPAGPINPYAPPETPVDQASVAAVAAHDLTREEVAAFVGDKHAYYWRNWRRAVGGSLRAGFNLAAFFLSFAWLLYRKMYREFFIGLAALIGVGILQGVAGALTEADLKGLDRAVDLAVAVTMGMLGNGLYLRRAQRVIASARAQEPDPERRAALLKARGGTSWISSLLAVVFFLGIWALVGMAAR